MKRTVLFALMIPLLLAGCGAERDADEWDRWRESLSAAGEIAFSAEITSRGEADAVTFAADVVRRGERTALTVTAPETIRGVTAAAEDGKTTLEYDGLILELDALREDSLPPCAAPRVLLEALAAGELLWTGRSGELRTAAFTGPDGETVTLWRDGDGTPVCAEIARGERAELLVHISDWKTQGPPAGD